jgi:MFS family permease
MEDWNSANNENTPLVNPASTTTHNGLLDPRGPYLKWIAVFFMCFLSFGSYYCYDNPAGLQDVMKDDLRISSSTFTAFYSWYSWPNVVLAAVGGILIDKWLGVARGAAVFCGFILVGQVIFGLGGYYRLIWLMNAGRFVFGIGGESLASAQNAYAVSWFFGKQLNFVFGLQLSFARVGSLVNMNTIHRIYDSLSKDSTGPHRIGTTLLIAVSTCAISLICALILWTLDNRRKKVIQEDSPPDPSDEFHIRDIRHFSASLYCVFIICVFYYVAIFPFIAAAQLLYISKYDLSPGWANACNSLLFFMSAILSPILGYTVDKTGRNLYWLLGSIAATIVAHALLAFLFVHPIVPNILMGISYSILAASLWPMVAFLVPKKMLGTAYGFMQSIQNLGLAVINIFTGLILDHYGYFMLEIFFIICLEIALLAAAFLYVYNSVKKGTLNDSPAVRRAKEAEIEAQTNSTINAVTDTPLSHDDDDTKNLRT